MSVSNAFESPSALSVYLSQLEAACKAYEHASDAFVDIKDSRRSDDIKLADKRAKEESAQLKQSLKAICDIARSAFESDQLLPDELLRLTERAAKIENMIIQLSFRADHDGSEITCGDTLREEGLGRLGHSKGA